MTAIPMTLSDLQRHSPIATWKSFQTGFFVQLCSSISVYCSLRLAPSPHRWTDFDDQYVIRRVYPPDQGAFCAQVAMRLFTVSGVKSSKPPFWRRD